MTMNERIRCFVAMWFGEDETSRSEMDQLFDLVIKPALDDCDVDAYRVDRDPSTEKIDDKIIEELDRCNLVVVDLTHGPETGLRGSVIFEAGYARGRQKPIIWMCRKDLANKTPFDIRQFKQIRWDLRKLANAKADLVEAATAKVREIRERISEERTVDVVAAPMLEPNLLKFFLKIAQPLLGSQLGVAIYPDNAEEERFLRELERRGLVEEIRSGTVLTYHGKQIYDDLVLQSSDLTEREQRLLIEAGNQASRPGEQIAFSVSSEDEEAVESLVEKGQFRLTDTNHTFDGVIFLVSLSYEGWDTYNTFNAASST